MHRIKAYRRNALHKACAKKEVIKRAAWFIEEIRGKLNQLRLLRKIRGRLNQLRLLRKIRGRLNQLRLLRKIRGRLN